MKFTEWFDSHTTAMLGRQMTQTFHDAAPGKTTFADAWDTEPDHNKLAMLADRYVSINELRPLKMYAEITLQADTPVADKTLPAGTKIGGFDHGHFVMSVLSDIKQRVGGSVGQRAWSLIAAHSVAYFTQHNSWLSLADKDYGTTGRCRIAGMILRTLCDIYEAEPESAYGFQARAYALAHITNIGTQQMRDDAQGDGLKMPHWRAFQVALLMAALERCRLIFGVDTTPLVEKFRAVVCASVLRTNDGKPQAFYYDVPEPLVPEPWTSLPGYKLGSGNGVEPWLFKYLPADAHGVILSVNKNLHPAVKAKFSMT